MILTRRKLAPSSPLSSLHFIDRKDLSTYPPAHQSPPQWFLPPVTPLVVLMVFALPLSPREQDVLSDFIVWETDADPQTYCVNKRS